MPKASEPDGTIGNARQTRAKRGRCVIAIAEADRNMQRTGCVLTILTHTDIEQKMYLRSIHIIGHSLCAA